ncbi:MAG: hypothetical protein EOO75_10830, partial [Myxococcales bacterium]
MAKKIVAVFSVSPTVLALRELEAGLPRGVLAQPGWGELVTAARSLTRHDGAHGRKLLRAAAATRGQRGLALRPVPARDASALRRFDLEVDLPTLLGRRGGAAALRHLLAFLGLGEEPK